MALRPKIVKAGSPGSYRCTLRNSVATPGSTCFLHLHPLFRTSPAQLLQPLLSPCSPHCAAPPLSAFLCRSASRQNRQSRLNRFPQRLRFSPSQYTLLRQLRQHSRRPSATFPVPQQVARATPGGSAFRSAHPAQIAQIPTVTQNAATPTAQPTSAQIAQTLQLPRMPVEPSLLSLAACTGGSGHPCGGQTPHQPDFPSYVPPRLVPPRSTTFTLRA